MKADISQLLHDENAFVLHKKYILFNIVSSFINVLRLLK